MSFRLWRKLADQSGFTLIELLGVAIIIIFLSLLALPLYAGITDTARLSKSSNDLRQVEMALERYKADYGHYPEKLSALIKENYLKPSVKFESAWSSPDQVKYLFYATDRPDSAQAFVLGDPGPLAECPDSASAPALSQSTNKPFPCGSYPNTSKPWFWLGGKPDQRLQLDPGGEPPLSMRTYLGTCDPGQVSDVTTKLRCMYKSER